MLNDFQRESRSLQLEMREDVARLSEQLAESEQQADALSADLAAGKAAVAAGKAQADQERLQSEEQLAEADRKIKAMRVEEIKLKDALGRSQAEETRLCEEVTDYRKRLTAVEVLGGILEAGYQKARIETGATTKENSDNVVRLRKELAEAKAANEELRGRLQRGAAEARATNDVGGEASGSSGHTLRISSSQGSVPGQ